jgi:hypothetical protein
MTPDHLIVVKYVDIVIRIQNNFLSPENQPGAFRAYKNNHII